MVEKTEHKILGFACVPMKDEDGVELIPVYEGDEEKYKGFMTDMDASDFKPQTKEEFDQLIKTMANTKPITNSEILKRKM